MKIKGNIADLKEKIFFFGEMEVQDGKIKTIKNLGDENPTENYILPGFVNSHIHIESTMLNPAEYSKIAVKHGTVAAVADPHEIANVCGEKGIQYMIDATNETAVEIYFGLPSCVPATPFETSGAVIDSQKTGQLLQNPDIHFLAEMMNFPGVIYKDEEVIKKLEYARKYNKPIDGHAPGLKGEDLRKYLDEGISTDHECTNIEEAEEKIAQDMKIQIREGSAAKDFDALFKLIDKYPDKIMLCTDDSHPDDLLEGHINLIAKKALKKDVNIFNLIKAWSVNAVIHYKLNIGLLNINDSADFIIVDNPKELNIQKTYIKGEPEYCKINGLKPKTNKVTEIINNFNRTKISKEDILVENKGKEIRLINAIEGLLLTKETSFKPKSDSKYIESDTKNDVLKLVAINRYQNEKPVVAFIKGFGLKNGAIASTVAHDSHNIIAVGTNDEDLTAIINKVIKGRGGVCAGTKDNMVYLQLEIGGLMTNKPVEETAKLYKKADKKAKDMGAVLKAPFMTLSFMALLVIPELKLSDKGLFDAKEFKFVNLINQ